MKKKEFRQFRLGKNDNQHFIIVIAVCFCLVIGYYTMFFSSALTRSRKLSSEIRALTFEVQKAQAHKKSFQSLDGQRDQLKLAVTAIEDSIVDADMVVALLGYISGIAEKNKVKVVKIKPLEKTEVVIGDVLKNECVMYRLPVLLDGLGGYHQLGQFINMLETGAKRMNITKIKITPQREDEFAHQFSLIASAFVSESK